MHLNWQEMGGVLLSEGNVKTRQHSFASSTICFICFQNGDDVSVFRRAVTTLRCIKELSWSLVWEWGRSNTQERTQPFLLAIINSFNCTFMKWTTCFYSIPICSRTHNKHWHCDFTCYFLWPKCSHCSFVPFFSTWFFSLSYKMKQDEPEASYGMQFSSTKRGQ